MKIIETNNDQWDIKESGVGTIIAGVIVAIGGVGALGWVAAHLTTTAWWWMLVATGVVGLGSLMIFAASSRQITLRRQGVSDIVTTKVIGGKQTKVSFNADQIVSVNLDTSDDLRTTTNAGRQETTRERTSLLYVLLRDNSEVMLATRKGGDNGVSINGFNMSGLMKAPLADEAQRIATFYGVPLSSRMNNVGSIETLTSAIHAVQQGITSVQQPGAVVNTQPQAQLTPFASAAPASPLQSVVPQTPPIQSAAPLIPPVQGVSVVEPAQLQNGLIQTPANDGDQVLR